MVNIASKIWLAVSHCSVPIVERAFLDEDNSSEGEEEPETDADRKNTLFTDQGQDLDELRLSWNDFKNDFVFTGNGRAEVIDISTDEEDVIPPTIKGKEKDHRALSFRECINDLTVDSQATWWNLKSMYARRKLWGWILDPPKID